MPAARWPSTRLDHAAHSAPQRVRPSTAGSSRSAHRVGARSPGVTDAARRRPRDSDNGAGGMDSGPSPWTAWYSAWLSQSRQFHGVAERLPEPLPIAERIRPIRAAACTREGADIGVNPLSICLRGKSGKKNYCCSTVSYLKLESVNSVCVQYRAPLVLAQIFGTLSNVGAGVVDEDVDPAEPFRTRCRRSLRSRPRPFPSDRTNPLAFRSSVGESNGWCGSVTGPCKPIASGKELRRTTPGGDCPALDEALSDTRREEPRLCRPVAQWLQCRRAKPGGLRRPRRAGS